jgi:hypothetical protein
MRRVVGAIARELVGLFVDDGLLAVSLLTWCAVVAIVVLNAPAIGQVGDGLLLVGGCIAALLVSVLRRARRPG